MGALLGRIGGSTWLSGLFVFAGLFVLSATWAVSTPLSASPDEPAHIIKAAAVVRGELIGTATERSGFTRVTVPEGIAKAWSWTCPAYHPETSAVCMGTISGGSSQPTAVETSAGLYNPLYYVLVGWPTLITSHSFAAVFAMRLLTALICSALFAVAISALFALRRSAVTGFAALAILTPTTVFLSGSVNPNAVEIAAGAALLSLLLLLVRGPALPRPEPALALVAVSGVLLANARGLSPLWMAMIAVIAIVAAEPGRIRLLFRSAASWIVLAILAVGAGFAVWWILMTNTLTSLGEFAGTGVSPPLAFVTMLSDKSLDPGIIGLFGWLDTPAPEYVYLLWSFLALGTVLGALVVARGRLLAAVIVAIAGFFLVPATVQAMAVQRSGYIWQGRYSLVAYAAVLVISAVAIVLSRRPGVAVPAALRVRAVILVGILAAVGQAAAVAWTLRRYAVGMDGSWLSFLRHPSWHAPGSNLIWIAFALVGAAGISCAWIVRSRAESTASGLAAAEGNPSPHLNTGENTKIMQ
jgi:hypothetical protein